MTLYRDPAQASVPSTPIPIHSHSFLKPNKIYHQYMRVCCNWSVCLEKKAIVLMQNIHYSACYIRGSWVCSENSQLVTHGQLNETKKVSVVAISHIFCVCVSLNIFLT